MTTTGPTLDRRAADYLDTVRHHLADLSPDERDDLLDDLESHVHEVAAAADGPLDDALGPPASFAAELRASAGLAPASGRPGTTLERVRRRTDALRSHRWTQAVVAFLPEPRPAWWAARGWLLVWPAAEATGGDSRTLPLPELWDNGFVGLVAHRAPGGVVGTVGRKPKAVDGRVTIVDQDGRALDLGPAGARPPAAAIDPPPASAPAPTTTASTTTVPGPRVPGS